MTEGLYVDFATTEELVTISAAYEGESPIYDELFYLVQAHGFEALKGATTPPTGP